MLPFFPFELGPAVFPRVKFVFFKPQFLVFYIQNFFVIVDHRAICTKNLFPRKGVSFSLGIEG